MKNVYIVDDNAGMRQSLEQLLSAYGFVTQSFSSGSLFMDEMESLNAGVAIIDLLMPDVSGFEVLGKITDKSAPIVPLAISAVAAAGTADKALELGAKGFFSKPFEETKLISKLDLEFQVMNGAAI